MKLYASTVDQDLLEVLVEAVSEKMADLPYYLALDAVGGDFQDYLVALFEETNDTDYLSQLARVFAHLNYMSNDNLDSMIGYEH